MKLTVTMNVSVDGVIQGLGGADEDRRGGFERGGWALPLLDTEAMDHINDVYRRASAFLRSWGTIEEMRVLPVGVALNSTPKYVAATKPIDPRWAGTTVLTGKIASAVRNLKARQAGELLVPGSGRLVRCLFTHGLVDELNLVTYPVVVGQGTRLFPPGGPETELKLVTSSSPQGGITLETYRPVGSSEHTAPRDRGDS